MMMTTRRGVLLAGAMALALGSFPAISMADDGRLDVVATTGMIGDLAAVIGGDHLTITTLMGPGVDPHAYRQTRSDIVATTRADLVLRHGHRLEAQMEGFFGDLQNRKPVVAVGEAVRADGLLPYDEGSDHSDPHVWMNPLLWADVAGAVTEALAEADPDNAAEFEANRVAYVAELEALHEYAQELMATVPEPARVLVSAHDAFAYFGDAYGFDVEGIQGISTESEAGLRRIAELVDLLVERQVPAVFVETSVSDRNVRALVEGAGAKGLTVEVGGELFSDAMGQEGTYEGTYLGMIDHNVTTIADALGGSVPEGGRLGRLGEAAR